MATEPDQNYDFDEACRFVIKLGMAAHRYGSNSARLEAFLLRARKALGFRSAFRSRPSEIVFAFQEPEDGWQRTHLTTMPGTGLELARLAKVGELVDAVAGGEVSVPDAKTRLDEIEKTPVPPQNPVDRTIVDVSTLEVRLAYPDTSPAVRPARDRQIEPEAAMRARAREIALLGCARR
ncbi:MAG: threonine/serine exporter family protein [Polyangiales bacterium]